MNFLTTSRRGRVHILSLRLQHLVPLENSRPNMVDIRLTFMPVITYIIWPLALCHSMATKSTTIANTHALSQFFPVSH